MAYDAFLERANVMVDQEATTAEPGVNISGLRIFGNPEIGENGSVELSASILEPADQRLATNVDAGIKHGNDGQSFDPFA